MKLRLRPGIKHKGCSTSPSPDPMNIGTDEYTSKGKYLLNPHFRPATEISEMDRPWFLFPNCTCALWMFLSFLKDHQLYRLTGGIPGPVIIVPLCIFFFFLATLHSKWDPHGILVPRPGIEPESPVLEAQSLNHWIPPLCIFLKPFLKPQQCLFHTKFQSDPFQLEHPKPGLHAYSLPPVWMSLLLCVHTCWSFHLPHTR